MTTSVEKSIQVDAPVSAVYNQWTQFEEFPQFMNGVQQVTQLAEDRLHWVAEIAGVKREWEARVLEQVPDQKVAWAATEGATNAGAVYFTALGADQTMVRISLEYEPEGMVEKAGDMLNIIGRQAQSDLEKFKTFIEARGLETGAWRGAVNEGASVGAPGVEHASSSEGDSGKAGLSAKTVAAGVVAGVAGVAAAKAMSSDDEETSNEVTEDLPPVSPATVVESKVVDVVVVEEEPLGNQPLVHEEQLGYHPETPDTPGRTI